VTLPSLNGEVQFCDSSGHQFCQKNKFTKAEESMETYPFYFGSQPSSPLQFGLYEFNHHSQFILGLIS
jgi:hypothetical protein